MNFEQGDLKGEGLVGGGFKILAREMRFERFA
jgi:hypothetical protein